MNPVSFDELQAHVNRTIDGFHSKRANSLENLKLKQLLEKKNPYLFRAKNITKASLFVEEVLNAFLSSSEEKMFGDFLEDVAIFVAGRTCDGRKSAAPGIDLEFNDQGMHYIVSVKSGPNWGNSSQTRKQAQDFQDAVVRLKQSNHTLNVQPVLGICYGKAKSVYHTRGYLKVCGQSFWHLISDDKDLYKTIIEPIGYRAKEHNAAFLERRDGIINLFTEEFIKQYCQADGTINWEKVVEVNSHNLT